MVKVEWKWKNSFFSQLDLDFCSYNLPYVLPLNFVTNSNLKSLQLLEAVVKVERKNYFLSQFYLDFGGIFEAIFYKKKVVHQVFDGFTSRTFGGIFEVIFYKKKQSVNICTRLWSYMTLTG